VPPDVPVVEAAALPSPPQATSMVVAINKRKVAPTKVLGNVRTNTFFLLLMHVSKLYLARQAGEKEVHKEIRQVDMYRRVALSL
jgi:hypothetical protein